jgi:EAL domain-containing protein (putative c-di-GMP-specific phosphodiesterase class I)/CheY-like chemotaxis protein
MNPEVPPPADPARWRVLLVDDEPAVHEMSRLILAGLAFEGREVELLSADSAAQARELLARHADIALALLDVVMETDDAGIALVQHIREQRRDIDMQIVLRTGQPGVAPEGDIMRRYEINGYFVKTEITAQRLHSIVISALRGYRHARSLRGHSGLAARALAPPPHEPSRLALAAELTGLDEQAAVLMQAQPEVALASNQVTGIELVPHWKTSLGLLPAARVGAAWSDGATRMRIVEYMLAQASFWGRAWRGDRGTPLTVSIPLVGEALGECATLDAVLRSTRMSGLPRGTLDLLVSEAALLGDEIGIRDAVAALRAAGVSLTLVDFGSQTISLQRLNHVVPDRLKLHRLFVRGVVHAPERMALARSLIALSQSLSVVCIADGVSTDADAQFFKWEGCDIGQGDALAPACAPGDVADFLRHGRRASH